MLVPVMKVGVVRVGMLERLVAVPVAVRLAGRVVRAVLMPVVRVVNPGFAVSNQKCGK